MTDDKNTTLREQLAETVAMRFPKGDPMAIYTLVSAGATIALVTMKPALAAKMIRDLAELAAGTIEEQFGCGDGTRIQ